MSDTNARMKYQPNKQEQISAMSVYINRGSIALMMMLMGMVLTIASSFVLFGFPGGCLSIGIVFLVLGILFGIM